MVAVALWLAPGILTCVKALATIWPPLLKNGISANQIKALRIRGKKVRKT